MDRLFSFNSFLSLFPDDDFCLEEIKKQRFPNGIYCVFCQKTKRHYKVTKRTAYSCESCRNHVYPLTGTIFEKSTTPLRLWFFALFLMLHTRGTITIKQLQRELEVTYKTAWRMHHTIYSLMEQQDGYLLKDQYAFQQKEHKWVFFKHLEIKVVQKQEPKDDE